MTLGPKGARRMVNPTYSRQNTTSSKQVFTMPEWADKPFTLYISYLRSNITDKMIFAVFRDYGLGMMRKDQPIELTLYEPDNGTSYPFQSAKIHFDYLFTRGENVERNLGIMQSLIQQENIQIVYQKERINTMTGVNEPERYWKIKLWSDRCVEPKQSTSTNSNIMVINVPDVAPDAVPKEISFTEAEMDEIDAELEKMNIQPQPSRMEFIDAATEFLMESQIREEGFENPSAWSIDLATGTSVFHPEITTNEGEMLAPAYKILDVSAF